MPETVGSIQWESMKLFLRRVKQRQMIKSKDYIAVQHELSSWHDDITNYFISLHQILIV